MFQKNVNYLSVYQKYFLLCYKFLFIVQLNDNLKSDQNRTTKKYNFSFQQFHKSIAPQKRQNHKQALKDKWCSHENKNSGACLLDLYLSVVDATCVTSHMKQPGHSKWTIFCVQQHIHFILSFVIRSDIYIVVLCCSLIRRLKTCILKTVIFYRFMRGPLLFFVFLENHYNYNLPI